MAYVRRNSSAALGRASDARITLRVAERLQPKPLGSATLKHRQPARGQADMKNRFLASLALAAMIAAPATAADLPYKAPPPLAEAYYDWSGAYVGLNVGGTHYNVTHHFPSPGAVTPDVTTGDHDAIFGIHAGAQWQWGAWVLGAEAARSGCSHECRMQRPAGRTRLRRKYLRRAQDHRPVHGGRATGLCLGPVAGLCDRGLRLRPYRERALLDHHRYLRPAGRPWKRRRQQQPRLVCGRRLRLHGPQGRAGRRDSRRRVSALRRRRSACVLRQSRLRRTGRARLRPERHGRHRPRSADHQDAWVWLRSSCGRGGLAFPGCSAAPDLASLRSKA